MDVPLKRKTQIQFQKNPEGKYFRYTHRHPELARLGSVKSFRHRPITTSGWGKNSLAKLKKRIGRFFTHPCSSFAKRQTGGVPGFLFSRLPNRKPVIFWNELFWLSDWKSEFDFCVSFFEVALPWLKKMAMCTYGFCLSELLFSSVCVFLFAKRGTKLVDWDFFF